MGNISRKMEILKNNQKEMIEIQTNKQHKQTEMKNAFRGLISWQDMTEERISEWQYMLKETSEMKKQCNKRPGGGGGWNRIF